jgi:glycosyltransferase involved in cell wall biosynthesis
MFEMLRLETASMTDQGSRSVRVVHLISTLGIYGAERWILTHIKSLGTSSIASHVLTFGSKEGADAFHRLLTEEGLSATHLAIAGRVSLRLVAQIRSCLVRESGVIVHTHGFKADILGYLATRGLCCRLVSTVHGWCKSEGLRIRLYEALSKLALRRCDRVYTLSPALRDGLVQDGFVGSRVMLIMNAIRVEDFDEVIVSRGQRTQSAGVKVLFAGRLCIPKGVYELLKGFAMAKLPSDSTLTFAGVGPERERLEGECIDLGIRNNVCFSGHVERMNEAYGNVDVVVLPSYSEGLPRVIMEAYASALPVIGTDIPGIRELVVDDVTGIVVPVADAKAVALALERIAADRDGAWRLGLRGRKLVEERFSASRQASEYQADYRKLMETFRYSSSNTEGECSASSTNVASMQNREPS